MTTYLPKIKGFKVVPVDAAVVCCDDCLQLSPLVFGPHADIDAMTWATEHQPTCPRTCHPKERIDG